jgi:very-short-patch-repair endonuclease
LKPLSPTLSLRERVGERGYTMKSLARKLRKEATDAELMLWKYLRAHRMAGYKFRRQVVIEPYIVDFLCLEARLIVEVDGGHHLEQVEDDLQRSVFLESLGYKNLRFWNHEVLGDTHAVLGQVHGYLTLPSPPPEG